MEPVRIAIIGAGAMGLRQARAFAALPQAKRVYERLRGRCPRVSSKW